MQFATPSAKSTFLHSRLPWHLPLTFASVCSLIGYSNRRAENQLSIEKWIFVCLLAGLSGWRGWDKCQSQQKASGCQEGCRWAGLFLPAAGAAGRFPQGSPPAVNVQWTSANTVLLHGDHSNVTLYPIITEHQYLTGIIAAAQFPSSKTFP